MSKLINIAGQPGAGKTHYIKNKVLPHINNNLCILDTNNEYPEFPLMTKIVNKGKYRINPANFNSDYGFDDFLNDCRALTNFILIIEDATIFLDGTSRTENFKSLLIGRRHKNLNIFLLFHSINRIPPFAYEMQDYMIVLKTGDIISKIKAKFDNPKILEVIERFENIPIEQHPLTIIK